MRTATMMVGLAGCDKSLPGMLMAMGRLNVPAVFLYGGTIMPGKFKGRMSRFRMFTRRWAAFGGEDERCRSVRDGMQRLSIGGKLRGTIHGQYDGVCGRGVGDGAAGQRFAAGGG